MPSKSKSNTKSKSKSTPKSKPVKKGFVKSLEQNFSPFSKKGKANLRTLGAVALAGSAGMTGKGYYDFVYSNPKKYLNEIEKAKYDELMKKTSLTKLKLNFVKLNVLGGSASARDLCGSQKDDNCYELVQLLIRAKNRKEEAPSGIFQSIKSWFMPKSK